MSKINKVLAVVGVVAMVFSGVAITVPAAHAATDTKNDTVTLTINASLILTLTGDSDFGSVGIASASAVIQNANVKSNFAAGYTLVLNDEDSTTSLVGTDSSSNTISTLASSGLLLSGQSTSAWGVYNGTGSVGSSGSTFQPMPPNNGTPITIASTSAVSSVSGDDYPVTYGVQISGNQAPDTYTDVVVYTLTSKP